MSQLTILVLILGPASTQLLFLSEHHDLYLHTVCDLVARVQDTEEFFVSFFLGVPPSFSQEIHELCTKLGRDLVTQLSAKLTTRVQDTIQEHIYQLLSPQGPTQKLGRDLVTKLSAVTC